MFNGLWVEVNPVLSTEHVGNRSDCFQFYNTISHGIQRKAEMYTPVASCQLSSIFSHPVPYRATMAADSIFMRPLISTCLPWPFSMKEISLLRCILCRYFLLCRVICIGIIYMVHSQSYNRGRVKRSSVSLSEPRYQVSMGYSYLVMDGYFRPRSAF